MGAVSEPATIDSSGELRGGELRNARKLPTAEFRPLVRLFAIDSNNALLGIYDWMAADSTTSGATATAASGGSASPAAAASSASESPSDLAPPMHTQRRRQTDQVRKRASGETSRVESTPGCSFNT